MNKRLWRDRFAAARLSLWTGAIPASAEDAFLLDILKRRADAEGEDELFDALLAAAVREGRIRDLDAPKAKGGRKPKLVDDVELLRTIRREFLPREWRAVFNKVIGVSKDRSGRRYRAADRALAKEKRGGNGGN
jgi:hypothetical protein